MGRTCKKWQGAIVAAWNREARSLYGLDSLKMSGINFESFYRKLAKDAKERKAEKAWKELRGLSRLKMRIVPEAYIEEQTSGPLSARNHYEDCEKLAPSKYRKNTVGLMKKRYGG